MITSFDIHMASPTKSLHHIEQNVDDFATSFSVIACVRRYNQYHTFECPETGIAFLILPNF